MKNKIPLFLLVIFSISLVAAILVIYLERQVVELEAEKAILTDYLRIASDSLKTSYEEAKVLRKEKAALSGQLAETRKGRQFLSGVDINYLLGEIAVARSSHVTAIGNSNTALLGDDAWQLRWIGTYDVMARVVTAVKTLTQDAPGLPH